jgi:hypothetical protein
VEDIIVHGGAAHEDEVLATMLALQFCDARVHRRNPSQVELDSPTVLVMDVGRDHNPTRRNFDHHQTDVDDEVKGECAFSLLVRYLELFDVFSVQRWFRSMVMGDTAGPFAVADMLGLPRFPFELESPVNGAVLWLFEDSKVIDPGSQLDGLLKLLGAAMLGQAERWHKRYQELGGAVKFCHLGLPGKPGTVKGWVLHEPLTGQDLYGVLQWLHDQCEPDVGFVLYHSDGKRLDDKGQPTNVGWDVCRFNDHVGLDFSTLHDADGVDFAHPGGFFVQLTERCDSREALRILHRGLTGITEPTDG